MHFTMEVNLDNAAFREGGNVELIRLLHDTMDRLPFELSPSEAACRDSNGNTCGEWRITGDRPARVVEGEHADLLTTGLDGLSGGDDDPAIAQLQRAITEGRVIVVVDRAAAQRALGRANR